MARRPRASETGLRPSTDAVKQAHAPPRRRGRTVFLYAVVLLAAAALFGWFQWRTPDLLGFDGYYHIKYSYLLRTEGLSYNLRWLQFTIYKHYYRDHHLLFHLLLWPFTFGDLRIGAKAAATVFPTVMAVCGLALLRGARVPWTGLWMVALAGASTAFLYRMLLPRPMAGSVALLFLAGLLLVRDRPRSLGVLTAVGVWYYDGFGMIVLLTVLFFAAHWLVDGRPTWRPLLWCLAGAAAGIILNPYFPRNVESYAFNFYRSFSGLETAKGGGSEWFQMQTWGLVASAPGAAVALFVVAVAGRWRRALRADTVAFIFLTAVTLLMVSRAQRYMEYYPPVALVAAALTVRDLLSDPASPPAARRRDPRYAAALALSLVMAGMAVLTIPRFRPSAKPYTTFKGAAEFLARNSQPGDLVFNVDYDDFPHLFFHNDRNYYVVGLDPIYLNRYDSRLFELWRDIGSGKNFDIRDTIRRDFDPACRWVVVESQVGSPHPFVIAAFKDVQAGKMRRVFLERIPAHDREPEREVFVYELLDTP